MVPKENNKNKAIERLSRKERMGKGLLKIGEIADLAGVTTSLVRYYTDIGLLRVAGYTKGGYRLYDREETIRIIRQVKPPVERRRTLKEIK
ncbi:MerR family DNA-binding transcriptional regulator, partial [bacterium]|nr:MerR family DNA-binding transcriptional regulator [bacterium]NIN91440.1 MerR family DNA-binding transcriptional regulator [bacterium]NIO17850.1 MerR family DNA-binding transcriptional regulator [bacterium]NIO72831.1 MerR family DNA-binding transcriptional regulator [bacterium]